MEFLSFEGGGIVIPFCDGCSYTKVLYVVGYSRAAGSCVIYDLAMHRGEPVRASSDIRKLFLQTADSRLLPDY